jgi:phage recombination protein Bet
MLSPDEFVATVKKTCALGQATKEEFHTFLLIAYQYDLDPLVRELYAFQRTGGGLQFIVGYDGWVKIANRHPAHRGFSYAYVQDKQTGTMEAITCIIKRAYPDGSVGTVEITEWMRECKRNSDPWNKWPIRMLRNKATIQCIRLAYSIAGIMDEDEAERYFDMIAERHKINQQAGSTPLDTAQDIPGEPKLVLQPEIVEPKDEERDDREPGPQDDRDDGPTPPPEEPKEEYISIVQRHLLEDLITEWGWSHRVIPDVIQEFAGCPIDQILVSQFATISKKIAKAGEARKKAKK